MEGVASELAKHIGAGRVDGSTGGAFCGGGIAGPYRRFRLEGSGRGFPVGGDSFFPVGGQDGG